MPDKKYLIEIPDMPDSSGVWDADKWERNKDKFMQKYPTANVFELGAYDPNDMDENDQFMLTFDNDEESSGVWDAAKWERNKDKFLAKYPDAHVNRVRYMDYWGDKAKSDQARIAELQQPDEERNARLAEIGYYDDSTGTQVDYANSLGLSPLSSAIEQNSVSGEVTYLDPRVEEFFANDTEYTDKQMELNRLRDEYEANPRVIEQREYESQMARYAEELEKQIKADMEADVDAYHAGQGAAAKHIQDASGANQTIQAIRMLKGEDVGKDVIENEKQERYASALKLLQQAKDARNVAGKGMAGGVVDTAKDWARNLGTQSDIEMYNEVGNILTALEQKVGNLNEVSDEVIEENLTNDEKALIRAFFEYNAAMADAGEDMSIWYKGGKIFAESIPFMMEFLVTGGLANSAGRAATSWMGKGFGKWIAKSAKGTAARAAKKVAAKTVSGVAKTVVAAGARTLAAPTTYKNIAEQSVQYGADGHLDKEGNMVKAAVDSYIEQLSEMSGAAFGKVLGGVGRLALGKTAFEKVGAWFGNSAVMQNLSKLGFHGLPEEVGEEIFGNALRTITGVDEEALSRMFEKDEFASMIIGFAPMTLFGAGMSMAKMGAVSIGAANAGRRMRQDLSRSYTEEQIDQVEMALDEAKDANEIANAIRPIIMGMQAAGAPLHEVQSVWDYAIAVAKKKAMVSAQSAQEMQLAQAKIGEAQERMGGRFWIEDKDGVKSVKQVVLNNGNTAYVVSEPDQDGRVAIINATTGQKGTALPEDIKEESWNGTLNAFGTGLVMADRTQREQQRMQEDRAAQINEVRNRLSADPRINVGTEGSPIYLVAQSFNDAGVRYVAQDGSTGNISWEQAADSIGMPIVVKTDAQIAQEEADALVAAAAERRAKRAKKDAVGTNERDNAVVDAENAVAGANEAARHIPMNEDGTVNEAAFWEQSPEEYVKWNDEQNQDGGQDSLEQVAIAKQELMGLLQEANAAQNTSNPTTRKAAKKEVERLADRIARLDAIEQSYMQSLEEEKAAVQQTAATPTSSMSEEDLESMDAQYQGILGKTRVQGERVRVMQEYLDKLAEGSVPVVLLTRQNYEEKMKADGLHNAIIRRVKAQVDAGRSVAGFMANGKVYLMDEGLNSIDAARITYIHERQHTFNRANNNLLAEVAKLLESKEKAIEILKTFVGEKGIGAYESLTLEGLADEIIAYSMEKAYTTEDFSVDLQSRGIPSDVISIITDIDNEQRKDQSLSQARRRRGVRTHAAVPGTGSLREDERNLEQVSGGVLEQQTARPSGLSGGGAQIGEGAEVTPEDASFQTVGEQEEEEPSSPFMAAAQQEGESIRFSIATEESLQDKIRKFAKTKDGKETGWTEDDIESIIAETESLIDAIHRSSTGNEFYDEFAYKEPTIRVDWRDGEAKPIVTWTRANIEYKYDMSADLLCINNEGLEQVLSSDKMVALMEMFIPEKKAKKGEPIIKFTAEDYLELYNTLRDLGFVVPCKGCFDAAGRFKMLPSVAQKFAAEVNAVIDERNKDPKAFDEKLKAKAGEETTIEGLPTTASTKSAAIAVGVAGDNLTEHVKWTQLMSADGQTKMLSDWGGIFRAWQRTGAGRPKDKLLPEPYYGDIVSSVSTIIGKYGEKTPSFRDTLVNQGTGLRRNSHSEFRPVLAIDEIQFMRDAFIRNLTVFKYMKELDDVRLFGKMGVKFNMSFFPEYVPGTKVAGLDKEGNYIASEESVGSREFPYQGEDGKRHYDGMKGWAEAQKYINKDVSLSSVIFSIPHLLKALTDVPTPSDMRGIWGSLIPFHSSGATTASLAMQGLGMARANGVGHGFIEAFTDYGKGVTNFEAVQNDRFGEGWYIVSGKKAGTDVEPGHKLEFANGNHYYNRTLGIHLFASGYILDAELPEGVLGDKGELNITDEQKKTLMHKFTIDYNDKVRELKGPYAYKAAADFYIAELPKLGLIPRFDFEVSEEKFLEMCEAANVDPRHPKLGWKGEGNSWSPIDSEAYYSLFCDYGMTDPATGEWAPHMPVGYVNEKGKREFRLPENAVEIVKDGLERFSEVRRSEAGKIDEAIKTFAQRSVEKGRISKKDAEKVVGELRMRVSNEGPIDLVEEAKKAQARHDAKESNVRFRVLDTTKAELKDKPIKLNGMYRFKLKNAFKGVKDNGGSYPYIKVQLEEVSDDYSGEKIAYNGILEGFAVVRIPKGLITEGEKDNVFFIDPKAIENELWDVLRATENYYEFKHGGAPYQRDWLNADNVRFRITPEQDKAYMDAVKAGDMEIAQRMVDEAAAAAGYTIRGDHGRVSKFTVFDRDKANPEGNWGQGFYFTNNEEDVENNYATVEGPDLEAKIEREVEKRVGIAEMNEEFNEDGEVDEFAIREEVEKEFITSEPNIVHAAIKMDKPFVVGHGMVVSDEAGNASYDMQETYLDVEYEYDEDGEIDYYSEPTGTLIDLIDALNEEISNYDWANFDANEILQDAYDGMTASQFESAARELLNSHIDELVNDRGDVMTSEILRAAIERAGFDGIIDNTVNQKFGTQRRYGRSMAGMDSDTRHYISFDSSNIKDTDPVTYDDSGNVIPLSERFNPENVDIRFRMRGENESAEEFMNGIIDDFKAKYNAFNEIIALDPTSKTQVAKFIGVSEEDISDEDMASFLKELEERDSRGWYNNKRIAIFVRKNVTDGKKSELVLIHENIHAINKEHPDLIAIGEYLWNTAQKGTREYKYKMAIAKAYPESEWFDEMSAYVVSEYMQDEQIDKLKSLLDSDNIESLNKLLNISGYGKDRSKQRPRVTWNVLRKRPSETTEESGRTEEGGEPGDLRFRTTEITPEVREEMDAIHASAILMGNFMKAPNGKPTNLTEEQWLMVRTKNFKNWFGDWENDPENASKVVDANGEPKVVYHGSAWRPLLEEKGNAVFKMRGGLMGKGAYFTDNIYTALYFAAEKYEIENNVEVVSEGFLDENGYVTEVFLNIRNEDNIRTVLEDTYYLATSPSQIKSATNNTGEFSEGEGDIRFSIRTKPAPKKAGKGYKVFYLKDGKLYPPMVANLGGVDTPVGVWLDAEEGTRAGVSKTGRPQVKQGGKGTQGGSGTLAYRPGWHLGEIPYAIQFNRKDENGDRTLFPADFVWAEVEYANDVDYQEEAMSYGMNANGKFQHSLAGLPKLPTDGSYRYRTNPNPETDPWIITGAMKVNRLLTPSEVDQMVIDAGREPQKRQEGAVTDEQIEALNKELGLEETVSFRFSSSTADEIDIKAMRGISTLRAFNVSFSEMRKIFYDVAEETEKAIMQLRAKQDRTAYENEKLAREEKELRAIHRRIDWWESVNSQLVSTDTEPTALKDGDFDLEPRTPAEFISKFLTMSMTRVNKQFVDKEGKAGIKKVNKRAGVMLTQDTLRRELGWNEKDWSGFRYILSESEGKSLDEIAEMISEDSDAQSIFAGMDVMDIKNEIIDFLQSVRSYADIRDYIKNERTREAKEESDYLNGLIESTIEQIESSTGMTIDEYNDRIITEELKDIERILRDVETSEIYGKFEDLTDQENEAYQRSLLEGAEGGIQEGDQAVPDLGDGAMDSAAAENSEPQGDSRGADTGDVGDRADESGGSRIPPIGNKKKGLVQEPMELSSESASVDEVVNKGRQKAINENVQANDIFSEKVQRLNNSLAKLRSALAAQREYDVNTVKIITALANELLQIGRLTDMSRSEIKRLLSVIKDATGKEDLSIAVERLMDIMIANQLRSGKSKISELTKIKASKVNASGVEVRGSLDVAGQQMLQTFKDSIAPTMTDETLAENIAIEESNLDSDSDVIRKNAENRLAGYYLAQQYRENILASEAEEKSIREEIKRAKEQNDAGLMDKAAYKEFVKSCYDAIRENRMERVTAYEKLANQLAAKLAGSILNAKLLKDAEKARIEQIHHFANSDMQGMPSVQQGEVKKGIWNNTILRFLFKPLATFDQMLRSFAPKSRNGEGYLWNHFMGGWLRSSENEFKGIQAAHEQLDAKVRSMFAGVKRWSDLFSIEKKLPTMEVKFWDGEKMADFTLTQGNLLYIYMVNKMTDGKMKLRKMGITEEDVNNIARELDPRFIELADWIQDTFLPGLREKYNTLHEKMFGAPMAAIDNYFPIRVLANARTREVDLAVEESSARPSTITGSIIKRTKNSLALDILGSDAFDVVLEHIEQMEHWAAFAEFNRDLNTLLSYRKFRNRVQNMRGIYGAGTTVWNNFRSVAEIAAGVYKPAVKGDSLDKLITNIAKGVTGAKISFRVYTALKQFLSAPAFVSDASAAALIKSLANPYKAWTWAMKELPLFEKRWKSRQAGDSRLMETESDWKLWKNKIVELAGRYGMTPNAFVDALTVSIGARAIYETKRKEYIKLGYTQDQAEEKAKRDATVLFNESQQSNESAFLSAAQVDRTVASILITVFRNSSMGYQRMYVDALRNIKHMLKKGYKAESLEYMKKQMMRDGLTEDQAERAANRIYNKSFARSATRLATFGFLVQFAWNLGPYMAYLLMGDDDDEKKDMIKDAAVRGLVGGPVEGLAAGQAISGVLGDFAMSEEISDPMLKLPATSDMESIFRQLEVDPVRAVNDIFNLVIQSGIGVNPQTLTDAVVAIIDGCNGDLETSKEAAFALMRILQTPQSQIEKLYMEEIDFTAEEALDMSVREFAERYAKYKVMRTAPLTKWMYSDEKEKELEDKYIKTFTKKASEMERTHGTEKAQEFFEYYDSEYEETAETLRDLNKQIKEAILDSDTEGEAKANEDIDNFLESEEFKRFEELLPHIKAYEAYRQALKTIDDPKTRSEYTEQMIQERNAAVEILRGE